MNIYGKQLYANVEDLVVERSRTIGYMGDAVPRCS